MSLSNSANTASITANARPLGVVKSSASLKETKPTFRAVSSCGVATRRAQESRAGAGGSSSECSAVAVQGLAVSQLAHVRSPLCCRKGSIAAERRFCVAICNDGIYILRSEKIYERAFLVQI